ncbi:hypothetical protein AB3N59_10440 [Leptospira sp. WS92.C1]
MAANSQTRYPAIVISQDFIPSSLLEGEVHAIGATMNSQIRKGQNLHESKLIQLEGLRDLNQLFQNPNSPDNLKFVGDIPGYTPGMTLLEYSDQVIQSMLVDAERFPIEVLKEFRIEITIWIYSLQMLLKVCAPVDADECKILSSLSDKYLYMREEIIKTTQKKMKTELGLPNE